MMQTFQSQSYLFGGNAPFIEELYEQYLADPQSVSEEWRDYFDKLQQMPGNTDRDIPRAAIEESFVQMAKQPRVGVASVAAQGVANKKQVAVLRLISAYRIVGARYATLDPLKRLEQALLPELDPATYGLTDADMALTFDCGNLVGHERDTLANVLARLKQTFCGNIGLEYMHITTSAQRTWVQKRFEAVRSTPSFSNEKKLRILKQITAAETLERYLHTKYVGQKRFSLEGGESMIAALDHLVQTSGEHGVQEMVIGMAHRGRLNVLVNTLGKRPADLFSEFEGKYSYDLPSGDVKYHMGFSSDIPTPGGPVHVSLAFNPSHLEIVNPVVVGSARARQQRRGDRTGEQVMPVLLHGDSAFIGLGTNQGTFNLSQTRGYGVGGTVHIVINNQIGFTTSDTRDTRSSLYCTDIAKMVEAPIFHVNGDDPEAVCFVVQAALDFRREFRRDVVIDLVCFRKLGHNEGDDPMLTQPMMYKKIAKHAGTRKMYADRLVAEGLLSAEEADSLIKEYRAALDKGEHVEQTTLTDFKRSFAIDFSAFKGTHWAHPTDTTLSAAEIGRLTDKLTKVPEDFKLHATVDKVLTARREMAAGNQNLDWGMAETLAYGSLLEKGYGVRISGEDSGRGTFSHRHAVLHDQNREKWDAGAHVPLRNLSDNQGHFLVIDSILNEEAVLAFEYGYSSSAPDELVIWEAQFGDFANGAQVVIDQFITSGETKWGRYCGLTMLLPHGYDGQGPEHSSARLERYLQMCAEHNVQIIMPSEASQMFHVLRRQQMRPYRKPMVIFMSKRLLRYKDSMSPLEDFTNGGFRPVIGDSTATEAKKVKRVVVCAGQVYYDLHNARLERDQKDVAIVRVEQLYPFPTDELKAELGKYAAAKEIMWVQEEPKNQGAWHQIRHRLEACMSTKQTLRYAGRPSSASPAVGYMSKHAAQLKAFLDEAMTLK
ncbi:2-oxoglutarate dehydrogenase E1 component [Chitinimonas sp. BJB300]|uniref:2-oxoglutarate dehydrogenase E1 component n=1 Tax=Chitinimonas sp. BJB300 TaxID=1559339 RepID=UPI000C1127DA|nr:2-oxoglutarate dehydrogenase E1 component [Chitinimonas sp. BJB300]PHV13278.1 2-oxoglutarate dehydrogenase E1 component [Chitinimonas sp. BJB300]TSJ86018.1 2-oxoglutarate dehydrogenase E1 component [Chitinimonas sp. BJB300]